MKTPRTERITSWHTPKEKALIQQACDIIENDMSPWIAEVMKRESEKVVRNASKAPK